MEKKRMVVEEKGSHLTLPIAGAAFSAAVITAVFAQSESNDGGAPVRKRYLPEYTASGDLILPKNLNEWASVGSPLTPNAPNSWKVNFPEFHNVYIEPDSYETYKKTGEFPKGTIFFDELQLTLPAENPDGSRAEASGRGFFPGKQNGADLTVKDSKRYADTGRWGYSGDSCDARVAPEPRCTLERFLGVRLCFFVCADDRPLEVALPLFLEEVAWWAEAAKARWARWEPPN